MYAYYIPTYILLLHTASLCNCTASVMFQSLVEQCMTIVGIDSASSNIQVDGLIMDGCFSKLTVVTYKYNKRVLQTCILLCKLKIDNFVSKSKLQIYYIGEPSLIHVPNITFKLCIDLYVFF